MAELIVGLVLCCWAWQDARKKSISVITLILGGVILTVLALAGGGSGNDGSGGNSGRVAMALIGAVPGILVLAASFFPGRGVGAADGIALSFLGIAAGWNVLLRVLIYSMAAFWFCSAFALLLRKITAESRLPFLPFLLAGYLGTWLEAVWQAR